MGIFDRIDFNNLPPHFNENAVREEIIKPLLEVLGYSRFDNTNTIVDGYRLKDPFVTKGTKKESIEIIPDYIIQVNNKAAFIVEAKAPTEKISEDRHIKQAHSYANHHEINVGIFMLCNGKELAVFSTKKVEKLFQLCIASASEEEWGELFELLSPAAFTFPHIFNYKQDYGVWYAKSGLPLYTEHYFYGVYIDAVVKSNDDTFSIQAVVSRDNKEYYASFDFKRSLFEDFMSRLPIAQRDKVLWVLTNQPYKYVTDSESDSFELSFSAILGTEVFPDEHNVEKYIPFNIITFL